MEQRAEAADLMSLDKVARLSIIYALPSLRLRD